MKEPTFSEEEVRKMFPSVEPCLSKCGNTGTIRGVCSACYAAIREYIKSGKVSEKILVEEGFILPSQSKIKVNVRARIDALIKQRTENNLPLL